MSHAEMREESTFEQWLTFFSFAALEVCALGVPVLMWLASASPETLDELLLSAWVALATSAVALGTYRGMYLDVGHWPAVGDAKSMPLRAAYYGGSIAVGAYLGAGVQLVVGSFWVGVLVPVLPVAALLAMYPRTQLAFQRVAVRPGFA